MAFLLKCGVIAGFALKKLKKFYFSAEKRLTQVAGCGRIYGLKQRSASHLTAKAVRFPYNKNTRCFLMCLFTVIVSIESGVCSPWVRISVRTFFNLSGGTQLLKNFRLTVRSEMNR